jgi:hypothetical protein
VIRRRVRAAEDMCSGSSPYAWRRISLGFRGGDFKRFDESSGLQLIQRRIILDRETRMRPGSQIRTNSLFKQSQYVPLIAA